jgi:hypothetical protein
VQIADRSVLTYQEAIKISDSRDQLAIWLHEQSKRGSNIAVAGPLQIPIGLFYLPGVDAFNPAKTSMMQLVKKGYDFIAFGNASLLPEDTDADLKIEKIIPGDSKTLRVPKNPQVTIYKPVGDPVESEQAINGS